MFCRINEATWLNLAYDLYSVGCPFRISAGTPNHPD
jgi:hypothetical protein